MGNFLALWGRSSEAQDKRPAAPRASQMRTVNSGERKGNYLAVRTMIAEGTTIHGSLSIKENTIVKGRIEGDFVAGDCMALLKETAVVTGKVEAGELYIEGEVHGGIRAKFVRLFPSARVFGAIESDKLVVDLGATVHSQDTRVGKAPIDVEPVAARPAPAAAPAPAPAPAPAAPVHELRGCHGPIAPLRFGASG